MARRGLGRLDVVAVQAGAVTVALWAAGRLPIGVALAIAAATASGYVSSPGGPTATPLSLRVALLALAGWLVASVGDLAPTAWIRIVAGEVALIAGIGAARVWSRPAPAPARVWSRPAPAPAGAATPRAPRPGSTRPAQHGPDEGAVVALLVAGSLLGVGLTVPDVEQIAVTAPTAAVVAVLAAVLSWRGDMLASRPHGVVTTARAAPGAVVIVAWIAAAGGFGRPSAVVGAVGCLGLLVLEPLVRSTVGGLRSDAWPPWLNAAGRIGLHAVVVLLCSRVAGLVRSGPWPAAAIVAVTWGVGAVLLVGTHRRGLGAMVLLGTHRGSGRSEGAHGRRPLDEREG